MADTNTRGGSHEQHVKAGEQSHKNTHAGASHDDRAQHNSAASHGKETPGSSHSSRPTQSGGTQGGTHEQHVKAGQQSHKNG